MVWVAGEPGIGKTTLIEHFVAGLGGIACARGQCVEHYGTGEPYLPVLEALAELCRSDRTLPALLRTVAPTWLLQLPWLSTAEERDALRRELAGVGPDRMLREMGELLDRYTEQRPLLLVTEDLHWSDRATIQLIDYVARRRGRARLMWLASFRLAEVVALDHPLNPLRHELRLHRLCEEIVLDPFSETEVADYVAQRSPSLARDEAFVRALHERTDGVPLFVSSVITEVMERTTDDAAVEAQLAAMAVPENLAAIIDHYIARLGQRAARAALGGRRLRGRIPRRHGGAGPGARHRIGGQGLRGAGARAGVAHRAACTARATRRPSRRIRSGMRCSARCCTTARRPRPACSCTARWARRSNGSVRPARRSPPSELAMHFDRGAAADGRAALLRRGGRSGAAALQPGLVHEPHRARARPCSSRRRRATSATRWRSRSPRCTACRPSRSLGVGSEARSAFERAYALLAGRCPGIRCAGGCCTASATC